MVIQNYPVNGCVEYWRAIQLRGGEVKLHVEENFLLKSRRIKGRASYNIERGAAQVRVGGLQRLGVEHGAVLRVQRGVDDYWLEETGSGRVSRIDAQGQAARACQRERFAGVYHFRGWLK
jgi:hypothetical protein